LGFANKNVRFLYLTTALVLVVAAALLWPAPQAPHFERPEMAFQMGISRTIDPGCRLPDGTDRVYYGHVQISCSHLQSTLGKVFNPADAVTDAKLDLERGAFRFIGRSGGQGSKIVIPGIECASEGLRNALYDSTCVVVLPAVCMSFPGFDNYAKAYNTTPLNTPAHSSSACK
jgi:hypothetical protein